MSKSILNAKKAFHFYRFSENHFFFVFLNFFVAFLREPTENEIESGHKLYWL